MLYWENLPNVSEVIGIELISKHHNNLLASHFEMYKIQELIIRSYYQLNVYHDIKVYVTSCDVYLVLKIMRHKLYYDLQSLLVFRYWWKDVSINLIIILSILINWKSDTYDSIPVIIYWFTKIIYYEPVKITIDISDFA